MARYLPEYGYEPIVITAGKEWHAKKMWNVEAGQAPHVRILRTGPDLALRISQRLERWRRFLRQVARILDPRGLWAISAIEAAKNVIKNESIDGIVSTSPPYAVALAAYRLKVKMGLPWMADFRDPWAFATSESWLAGIGYLLDRFVQSSVFRTADTVVVNTRTCYCEWTRSAPLQARGKGTWITNGFKPPPALPTSDNRGSFRIVHAGVFYYTADGGNAIGRLCRRFCRLLSYRRDDVDRSVQSAGFLLRAIRHALDGKEDMKGHLEVLLVGKLAEDDRRLIKELRLENVVITTGQLPWQEAAKHIARADVLYLPFWHSRTGRPIPRIPSKVYQYIGSYVPTLAVIGSGETREILVEAGIGKFCRNGDVNQLAAQITELYLEHEDTGIRIEPDRSFVEGFRWEIIVARLSEVLNEATV